LAIIANSEPETLLMQSWLYKFFEKWKLVYTT